MKSIRCPDTVYDFKTKRTEVMTSQKQLCEIMGMTGISSKNKMKNVHLPKISLFVQIGEEMNIVSNLML